MAIGNNGVFWFGGSHGMDRFDGTNWTHFDHLNSGFSGGDIYDIFVDENDKVWVATNYGLSVFDGVEWTTLTKDNSILEHNFITQVAGDTEGNVWIGTVFDGIYKYSPTQNASIKDNMNSTELSIYPNPFSEMTTIDFVNPGNIIELKVYDLSGKCLLHDETTGDQFIVRKDQLGAPGLYLVSIQTGSGIVSGKIIVQ